MLARLGTVLIALLPLHSFACCCICVRHNTFTHALFLSLPSPGLPSSPALPTALSVVRRAIRADPARLQRINTTTAEGEYRVTRKELQAGAGGAARAGLWVLMDGRGWAYEAGMLQGLGGTDPSAAEFWPPARCSSPTLLMFPV